MVLDKILWRKVLVVKKKVLINEYFLLFVKKLFTLNANVNRYQFDKFNFKSKLVQRIVQIILNKVCKPSLDDTSYWFKLKKSQHTALLDVQKSFKECIWIICKEISAFFNTVNCNILIDLLQAKVRSDKFIKLIKKGFKSKMILLSGLNASKGMCSSVLLNIYFEVLDKWIVSYKRRFYKNKQYNILLRCDKVASLRLLVLKVKNKDTFFKNLNNYSLRRFYYIRYINNLLIGLICTKNVANSIKKNIFEFMTYKLNLLLMYRKSFFYCTDEVPFLGYKIRQYHSKNELSSDFRSQCRKLILMSNRKKIIRILCLAGFCNSDGLPIPNMHFLNKTQKFSFYKARTFLYNLSFYYKLASNRKSSIMYIAYIIGISLAKMYAAKFRLKTSRQVFKRIDCNMSKPYSLGFIDLNLLKCK
jgi:hypothetical protein